MSEFAVDIDSQPNGMIARLRGSASNIHAESMRNALANILQQRANPVIIDLGELDYIASAALAELISFRQNLQSYGGCMRLAGARDQIAELFEKTRLVELFPMYPSATDALTAD